MPNSWKTAWLIGAWIVFLAFYTAMSHYLGPGTKLPSFGNVVQCFVPVLANAGLLANAGTPHRRRNLFWMLLALSCSMWMWASLSGRITKFIYKRKFPACSLATSFFFCAGSR